MLSTPWPIQALLESQAENRPPVDNNNLSDIMRRIHDVGVASVVSFLNILLLQMRHQQLPPFEDGCYWWGMAEGMGQVIAALFRESRACMSSWLADRDREQTIRWQKWQRLLDDDTTQQERLWRAELAHTIDHCSGPGSKKPHDRTIIYAPAVTVSLRSRARANEDEWRPFIVTIRGSHPSTQDVNGILYRMLRAWLAEVEKQLRQQCRDVWTGSCPARVSSTPHCPCAGAHADDHPQRRALGTVGASDHRRGGGGAECAASPQWSVEGRRGSTWWLPSSTCGTLCTAARSCQR